MGVSGSSDSGLQSEEELSDIGLLWAIDRAILGIDENTPVEVIEELFIDKPARFCGVHGVARASGCLVFMDDYFRPLRHFAQLSPNDSVALTPSLERFAKSGDLLCQLIKQDEDPALFDAIRARGVCVVAPIYTPGRHLLCVLVFRGGSDAEYEKLRDPELSAAINGLASQLTIAYRQFERARYHSELHGLWTEFLEHNLAPTVCFRSLARRIPRFLPTFGPLGAVDPSTKTQILMVSETTDDAAGPDHLVIRGTTGKEHGGTRVAIERSISGLLITNPDLPFFCADPTAPNYRHLYRNYFGDPTNRARTELAVRMNVDGRGKGIINMESRLEDAFPFLHRQLLMELAGTFGSFAAVLEQRLTMNAEMQHSVATSTRNYLEALASTFRHGIATPLASQRIDTDNLGKQIALAEAVSGEIVGASHTRVGLRQLVKELKRLIKKMHTLQQRLFSERQETAQFSADFTNDISGYADEGQLVLREIVNSAIQLANNCLLGGKARNIRIKILRDHSENSTRIYCSTLVKQHLYSIFHNAVDAINERMNRDRRPGQIIVRISPVEIPAGQEDKLNRAWLVKIRDNGPGVTREQLAELRKFDPGTTFKSGGHGYGLTAAQRYIASIGGRIELFSELGKYFEVALYLEEYNPLIHGRRKRLSSKGGIYG